jgi:AcrR family transcriptional regulator
MRTDSIMAQMKDKIKEVAIDLFYKKSYFGTSIRDIARLSGIKKASIYYHYSNKEDILVDIFKTTMMELDANLERYISGVEDTEERLRMAIVSHVIFHIERQKEVLIADSELRGLTAENYKEIIIMRDNYEEKFQNIIKQGIEEGIFSERDFKVVSYGIITMCTAVSIWFNSSGRLSKEEVARIYSEFIFNGLKR